MWRVFLHPGLDLGWDCVKKESGKGHGLCRILSRKTSLLSSGMAGESMASARYASLTACCSKTRLILDKEKRIIAVLVGQPDDPMWKDAVNDAAGVMQEVEWLGA